MCVCVYYVLRRREKEKPRQREKSNFDLNLLSISHRYLLCFPFIYVFIYIFWPLLLYMSRLCVFVSVCEWVSKQEIILLFRRSSLSVQVNKVYIHKMLMHHLLLTLNNSWILYALPFYKMLFLLWRIEEMVVLWHHHHYHHVICKNHIMDSLFYAHSIYSTVHFDCKQRINTSIWHSKNGRKRMWKKKYFIR